MRADWFRFSAWRGLFVLSLVFTGCDPGGASVAPADPSISGSSEEAHNPDSEKFQDAHQSLTVESVKLQ
ncbi:MAG TPA: hypothetical protein VFT74_11415 [Isosphaeraceae bacterium]|nr:hypothetical protein [Isosphaeraceae bacterium]